MHSSEETGLSKLAVQANAALEIVVIDDRRLVAECLSRCLQSKRPHDRVRAFPSVIDWLASSACAEPSEAASVIIVLSIGASRADDPKVAVALQMAHESSPESPVIMIADGDDATQILGALDHGARGYIPTNVTLDVAINAMLLVGVGGTFVPASSLVSSRLARAEPAVAISASGMFTVRQAAVIEALRKGKSNKIIAYELNMRESTVKVHVRNIMKRLKAKNRTEVAFIANTQIENFDMTSAY